MTAESVAKIRQTSARERGFMAWEAWVEHGIVRYSDEYGTYARTRRGAERKARALMRSYLASRGGPDITVEVGR